ncbi:MAG: hypothetical protein JWO44_1475 [Bacteroidetes bacterium]|nr:hypothetical protein [Bacteroidota bacterium]
MTSGLTPLKIITNTNVEPFSHICYQQISRKKIFRSSNYMSTGFLIRRNIILTAGHNIYSNAFSTVSNIKIFPGRYKETYTYDVIEIPGTELCQASIRVHPNYSFTKNNKIDYDFGIIIIPEAILKNTKNWPTAASFELDKLYTLEPGHEIHVAGFPASHGYDGSLMTAQQQACGNVNEKTFSHEFDTQTGNSGSPVWVEINGKRIVVGVHTFAEAATKLTLENIDHITKWINTVPQNS